MSDLLRHVTHNGDHTIVAHAYGADHAEPTVRRKIPERGGDNGAFLDARILELAANHHAQYIGLDDLVQEPHHPLLLFERAEHLPQEMRIRKLRVREQGVLVTNVEFRLGPHREPRAPQ